MLLQMGPDRLGNIRLVVGVDKIEEGRRDVGKLVVGIA
jgi:hypothetical protein